MQDKPTSQSKQTFEVLEVALQAIEVLAPVVARIKRCDRELGEQVRDALSSVVLNIGEGNRSQGGLRITRFSSAAASNYETRAGLRAAVAWGYVNAPEIQAGDELLDRVAAMLWRLGARR